MLSGSFVAKCKECNCEFIWTIDSAPFVDTELVGTCSKCINKESHDCYSEILLDENEQFTKVGYKDFGEIPICERCEGDMKLLKQYNRGREEFSEYKCPLCNWGKTVTRRL